MNGRGQEPGFGNEQTGGGIVTGAGRAERGESNGRRSRTGPAVCDGAEPAAEGAEERRKLERHTADNGRTTDAEGGTAAER